jgi:hypothetical protein
MERAALGDGPEQIKPKLAVRFQRYLYATKALQRFSPSICSQEYFPILLENPRYLSRIPG